MEFTTLREHFPGHYWPTAAEFDSMWAEACVVLDASALLGFYRYSESTQNALAGVLERFGDRVFVPHQAAEEFQRNRLTVMRQQISMYAEIEAELAKSMEQLRQRANQLRRHPVLEADEVLARVARFEEDLRGYIESRKSEHAVNALDASDMMEDPTRDRVEAVIGERVGPPYNDERTLEVHREAEQRFKAQIPPGYLDASKDGERKYGDVVFWYQALDYAVHRQTPIIVVTDDQKEDWWWRFDGKTLGPRHELVEEVRRKSDQLMFMYTTRGFLENARSYLKEEVSDEAISEVRLATAGDVQRQVEESASCPHCGWGPVVGRIGTSPGSSSIWRCPSCEYRFHTHRTGDGELLTSPGSLGRRVMVECPECSETIASDFRPGESRPRERVCLNCYANLEVRPDGQANLLGYTSLVDTNAAEERTLYCPRCELTHGTFARRGHHTFAVCDSEAPTLLLRGVPDS